MCCLSESQETLTHQSILLIVALDGGQHQAQQLWDVWPQALILGQAVHHLHDDVAQLVLCMQKGVVSKKSLATSQGLILIFVQLVLYSRKGIARTQALPAAMLGRRMYGHNIVQHSPAAA